MKRRDFLEISAAASAGLMLGSLTGFRNAESARDRNHSPQRRLSPRMNGGCRDHRLMNDSIPGFFEREIIDSWA